MPIIYSLVARGVHVLAEYSSPGMTGNYTTITRSLLKKIPTTDGKMSYIYDEFLFHYMVSDGLTYLTMSDRTFARLSAFQFLNEIRTAFLSTYGDRGRSAIAFQFNADFQRVLNQHMEKFNATTKSKITMVHEEIAQVKDIMIKNIELVLERGERIELLVAKTEELDMHAIQFHRGARDLKRSMWWKNAKLWVLIVLILLAVIYVIVASQCGGLDLPKCR